MALTGKTHLYPILAHPVGHVRGPVIINPAFERMGLDAFVVPLHVRPEDLADVVPRLAKMDNVRGAILTIPHKEAMVGLCDELGADGRLAVAVNVVRFDLAGGIVGDNVDGVGFIGGAVANGITLAGRKVLLVGAGGAGRAIAHALVQNGAAVLGIANRTRDRADSLAAAVTAAAPGAVVEVAGWPAAPAGYDVIVNATSLGLHDDDPLPFDPQGLAPATDVIDIIVPRTRLQDATAARGNRVIGGQPMVDYQIERMAAFFGEAPAGDG